MATKQGMIYAIEHDAMGKICYRCKGDGCARCGGAGIVPNNFRWTKEIKQRYLGYVPKR